MKHIARYLTPGVFFPEESTAELTAYSVVEAKLKAPEDAYCFVLYEVEDTPDLGPDFTVVPKHKNESGRYYLGGDVYDESDLALLAAGDPDKYRILLSNLQCNRTYYKAMIRCRTGNWQPVRQGDEVLPDGWGLPK